MLQQATHSKAMTDYNTIPEYTARIGNTDVKVSFTSMTEDEPASIHFKFSGDINIDTIKTLNDAVAGMLKERKLPMRYYKSATFVEKTAEEKAHYASRYDLNYEDDTTALNMHSHALRTMLNISEKLEELRLKVKEAGSVAEYHHSQADGSRWLEKLKRRQAPLNEDQRTVIIESIDVVLSWIEESDTRDELSRNIANDVIELIQDKTVQPNKLTERISQCVEQRFKNFELPEDEKDMLRKEITDNTQTFMAVLGRINPPSAGDRAIK